MKAFSLIELIIVIAIIMIIGAVSTTFGAGTLMQNNLETDKLMLVSSLRKAQNYAMVKKNGLSWGVCLSGGGIRVFGGTCASPTIKDDYDISSETADKIISYVQSTQQQLNQKQSTRQSLDHNIWEFPFLPQFHHQPEPQHLKV
jgi:Tfp pilus assembly protein FimT